MSTVAWALLGQPTHHPGDFARYRGLLAPEIDDIGRAQVRIAASALFGDFVAAFGEHRARTEWAAISKRPRGAPKGSRDHERDAALLRVFDAFSEGHPDAERPKLPRRLSEQLHAKVPRLFGQSAVAIEKHIRRLLKRRAVYNEKLRALYGAVIWPGTGAPVGGEGTPLSGGLLGHAVTPDKKPDDFMSGGQEVS